MAYYNKIALIQQIWYFHVFSWSLICSPNVRKKCKKMCQKISRKIYRKKQSRINSRKRCQKICQKNDSRYVRIYIYIYMSETMSEDLSTISEDGSGHLSLYIYIYLSSECMSGQRNGQEICQHWKFVTGWWHKARRNSRGCWADGVHPQCRHLARGALEGGVPCRLLSWCIIAKTWVYGRSIFIIHVCIYIYYNIFHIYLHSYYGL